MHVSDKRVSKFRTICEVHREIYDVLIGLPLDDKLINPLIDKLNEAYKMGKRMDRKLREYKFGYDKNWLEDNQNFTKSFKRRNIKPKANKR